MDVFAPNAVVAEKVERRFVEGHDVSDATVEVMKWQQETEEPITQEEKALVIRVDSTDPQFIISSLEQIKEKGRF